MRELMERSLALPYVRPKQSRMASPQSRALSLPDEMAAGPPEAFIDDHEFCHLHPLPEGSIHLTLPDHIREAAVERGWAEPHPAARMGFLTEALVMVYAPRNPKELAIVLNLICSSYQFARWGIGKIGPVPMQLAATLK
jgi:phospholipase/carboxylesterase